MTKFRSTALAAALLTGCAVLAGCSDNSKPKEQPPAPKQQGMSGTSGTAGMSGMSGQQDMQGMGGMSGMGGTAGQQAPAQK